MANPHQNDCRNTSTGTQVAKLPVVSVLHSLSALSFLFVVAAAGCSGDKATAQIPEDDGTTAQGAGPTTGSGGADGGMGGMGTGGAGGMGGMAVGGGGAGGMAVGGGGTGGMAAGPQIVLDETFQNAAAFTKTDGNGIAASFFAYAIDDYWGITDGTNGGDFGSDNPPSLLPAYAGLTDSFMVAQDMDADDLPLPVTMSWAGLDITNLTNLEVSLHVAEGIAGDGLDDIDAADFLRIEAVIDGGPAITVLELRGDKTTNGVLREDSNLDGIGDGGVAVGPSALPFTKLIGATGVALDLRVTMSFDAHDEDVAIDDLLVTGELP